MVARLAGIALFKDAGIDRTPFEARSHWRRFEPDEILVDFDDLSTDVYFLLSGVARSFKRKQSGKEVTRGEVGIMPSAVFRELVFASPTVADRLLRLLAGRVRELNSRVMEQAVLDL